MNVVVAFYEDDSIKFSSSSSSTITPSDLNFNIQYLIKYYLNVLSTFDNIDKVILLTDERIEPLLFETTQNIGYSYSLSVICKPTEYITWNNIIPICSSLNLDQGICSDTIVFSGHLYMSKTCLNKLVNAKKSTVLSKIVLPTSSQEDVISTDIFKITLPFDCIESGQVTYYPAIKLTRQDGYNLTQFLCPDNDACAHLFKDTIESSFNTGYDVTFDSIKTVPVLADHIYNLHDKAELQNAIDVGWILFHEQNVKVVSLNSLLLNSIDEFIALLGGEKAFLITDCSDKASFVMSNIQSYFSTLPTYNFTGNNDCESDVSKIVFENNYDILFVVGSANVIQFTKRLRIGNKNLKYVVFPNIDGIVETFCAQVAYRDQNGKKQFYCGPACIPDVVISGLLDYQNTQKTSQISLRFFAAVIDGAFTNHKLCNLCFNFFNNITVYDLLKKNLVNEALLFQIAKLTAIYESIFRNSTSTIVAQYLSSHRINSFNYNHRFWILTALISFLINHSFHNTYTCSRKIIADSIDEVCNVLQLKEWREIPVMCCCAAQYFDCPSESLPQTVESAASHEVDISESKQLLSGKEFVTALSELALWKDREFQPIVEYYEHIQKSFSELLAPNFLSTPQNLKPFYDLYHRIGAKLLLVQVHTHILSALHEFCHTHGLSFYLQGDTKYALERFGELLPFCDQVCVAMPFEDINKMVQLRYDLDPSLGLYKPSDDWADCFPGVRIYAQNTRWELKQNIFLSAIHKEIYVQVMPIYSSSTQGYEKRWKIAQYIGILITHKLGKPHRKLGYKGKVATVLVKPFSVSLLSTFRSNLLKAHSGNLLLCDRGITGLPSKLSKEIDSVCFAGAQYSFSKQEILTDGSEYIPKACLNIRAQKFMESTYRIAVQHEREYTLSEPDLKVIYPSVIKKLFRFLSNGPRYIFTLARACKRKLANSWKKNKPVIKGFLRTQFVRVTGFFRGLGICITPRSKELKTYRNKYAGQRCFLIGNGPSLRAEDLDLLQNEITFACNFIHKIYGQTSWRPTFHCISDSGTVRTASWDIVLHLDQSRTTMLIREFAYKFMAVKPDHAVLAPYISTKHYKVHGNFLGYHYISHATVMSMMLEAAMYMGFSEIYLLGVDATTSSDKGGNFANNYFSADVRQRLDQLKKRAIKDYDVFERRKQIEARQRDAYEKIAKYAKKHHFKIFNATRGGELEVFERVDFDTLISKKKDGGQS